ncbi:MAG: CBS domain-containing protein [Actinomycetota bacterium]|nr:CBS domain-containing protein [Actinomycetota bacterium]
MTHAYVKDVMTADVVAVRADASYLDLAAQLRTHRVSGFPVVDDDGKVIGVVSESDLLAAGTPGSEHPAFHHQHHHQQAPPAAADLMTHPAVTIGSDEPVRRAAALMSAGKLRRLPVVDHGGRLVGILSRTDVLSVFARPDEEIRREATQDVIADGFFLDPAPFTVTVKDGIVTLAGPLGSVILGRSIVDQIGHLEGVVAVRDRFSYPLPARSS